MNHQHARQLIHFTITRQSTTSSYGHAVMRCTSHSATESAVKVMDKVIFRARLTPQRFPRPLLRPDVPPLGGMTEGRQTGRGKTQEKRRERVKSGRSKVGRGGKEGRDGGGAEEEKKIIRREGTTGGQKVKGREKARRRKKGREREKGQKEGKETGKGNRRKEQEGEKGRIKRKKRRRKG